MTPKPDQRRDTTGGSLAPAAHASDAEAGRVGADTAAFMPAAPSHALVRAASLTALSTLLAACASAPSSKAPAPVSSVSTLAQAHVAMAPASASLVSGRLTLTAVPGGVRITGELGGLQRGGTHAIHIHEKGDCSAVDATSAGGHFNPQAQPHGRAGTGPHHGGDMDNLVADARGVAKVDVRALGVTLGGGAADVVGRAVVVHAKADDYQSQPAGNAGARVACGVISAS
jgi:Cu-Zn family superoxide dismutase